MREVGYDLACISQNRLTIFRTLNMILPLQWDAVMNVKM